jgi:hypothetical protein
MRGERFHFSSLIVPHVAVFIMRTPDGTHTGILHRNRGQLFVLDLLWDERLRSAPAKDEFACVVPRLEPEEVNDVTGMCRLIEQRNLNPDPHKKLVIPFAFRYHDNTHFSATGELILGDGLGLTCSTFVLKVFEAAKVPLADASSWQPRPGDDQRHAALLQLMSTGIPPQIPPAEPDRVAKVAAELPCIRVRPEEAAAAGMADGLRVQFHKAERGGRWLLELLTDGYAHASI